MHVSKGIIKVDQKPHVDIIAFDHKKNTNCLAKTFNA